MKICTKCRLLKEKYYKDKRASDGLRSECADCLTLAVKKYDKVKRPDRKVYFRNWSKRYYKENINGRISGNLRRRIWTAIKNNQKSGHTLELLGCTINEFKRHLQEKFTIEMSWENYGTYWEIDHIKPCASFDLTNPIQQKECFHYTNTQPLTISENRKKHDSVE